MTMNQRYAIYSVIGLISICTLTYMNYQRMISNHRFHARSEAITRKCIEIKNKMAELTEIPNKASFVFQNGYDGETALRTTARSASLPIQSIHIVGPKQIGKSEYFETRIEVTIGSNIRLDRLLDFIRLATGSYRSANDEDNLNFVLNSLQIEDPQPGPVIEGKDETWKCSEMTLSYLTKSDKSPR